MKTRRFNLLSAMLLLGVLCLGFASCSKDDDGDDDPSGGGSGWVDDDDEPGGGGTTATDDMLVGLWTYSSEADGVETTVRFTQGGVITYEYMSKQGDNEVSVVAEGQYSFRNGEIEAVYDFILVNSSDGDDSFGIFTDGGQATETYEPILTDDGADKKLMLVARHGADMELEKYDRHEDLPTMISGEWIVSNTSFYVTEIFEFTADGRVTYKYSMHTGNLDINMEAHGTYELTEDLRVLAEFDDIRGEGAGFTEGERRTKEYYIYGLYDLYQGGGFRLSDTESGINDLVAAADSEDKNSIGFIAGEWTCGEMYIKGQYATVNLHIKTDYTGWVTATTDDGINYVYPFMCDYEKDEYSDGRITFDWMGDDGLLFDGGVEYKVVATDVKMVVGDILFTRIE